MQPILDDQPLSTETLASAYADAHRHSLPHHGGLRPEDAWGETFLDAFRTVQPDVDAGLAWLCRDLTARIARNMSPFAGLMEATPAIAELHQDSREHLADAENEYKEALRALLHEALALHFVPMSPFDEPGLETQPVEVTWRQIQEISGLSGEQVFRFPPGLW